jgi:hydrogenase maturation protein HypF
MDVAPVIVAHDLHPDYLSTKWALDQPGVRLVGVQHHHAHIAACLVDNGEDAPVIGVAFDGLGYGTDGTLWGGEFLVADLERSDRLGHLAAVPMPGGAAAIREPWRMAAAYLDAAGLADRSSVAERHAERWAVVLAMARGGGHAPLTSSAGRLFDAVAALLGVRDAVTYEGQAAIELERLADPDESGTYGAAIDNSAAVFTVRGADLVAAAHEDGMRGVPPATIAGRVHRGVADLIRRACLIVRERTGLGTVALSGGVFQNVLLLGHVVSGLERDGFRVLRHQQVPPNDGGLSLGQAVIAARARAT